MSILSTQKPDSFCEAWGRVGHGARADMLAAAQRPLLPIRDGKGSEGRGAKTAFRASILSARVRGRERSSVCRRSPVEKDVPHSTEERGGGAGFQPCRCAGN